MTADDDMHDKHGLPPRPPQLGRDEGLREAAELLWCAAHGTLPAEARLRGYLDGPEQQAEVRAVSDLLSRLPLLTAERERRPDRDDLPGMWEAADLSGGEADTANDQLAAQELVGRLHYQQYRKAARAAFAAVTRERDEARERADNEKGGADYWEQQAHEARERADRLARAVGRVEALLANHETPPLQEIHPRRLRAVLSAAETDQEPQR